MDRDLEGKTVIPAALEPIRTRMDMVPVLRVIVVTLQRMKDPMINQTVSFYMSIEFSLNVFNELTEFSEKIFVITAKVFELATSFVSD